MTSTERVAKFKRRQRERGRKPLQYLASSEVIQELRWRAKGLDFIALVDIVS
jgi:hypothetical protein